ncbi:MAG: tRNA nucleotidyltransferase [Conexibacter sp.]|nr:tRNA nucleotidyltransferase [Conexibacter sp.]
MLNAAEALAALRAVPCGARALEVLAGQADSWVVGGAVRDALLGRLERGQLVDLDIVVEGDPEPVARALGEIVASHERFGTYEVVADGCLFDVVRARAERYAAPGALPEVIPAGLEDDLLRRDFTVNALALNAAGVLHAAPAAQEDLVAGRLRVLHAASFRDDPTRLWRMVRYAVRLGFVPEPGTQQYATEAVRAGALETVSGDRLGTELRLALQEPDPLAVLHAAQNQGLVADLDLDPARVAQALALLPADAGRPDLALLGAVIGDGAWAAGYGFTAAEQRILDRCAVLEPVMPGRPSEVAARLRGEPVEAVAVAGAKGDPETAGLYLHRWRHVGLEIDGHDLLAAGVAEGPDVGRRLAAVLARRLDGDLAPGRDAELAAALDAP